MDFPAKVQTSFKKITNITAINNEIYNQSAQKTP